MSSGKRTTATLFLAAMAIALTGLSTAAFAEVGVVMDPSQQQIRSAYIMQSIVDDPEPVGVWWRANGDNVVSRLPLNLTGDERNDGRPSMVVHPVTRIVFVFWARNSETGYDIVFSRFESGAWTDIEVLVDLPEDALDPFVSVDPADGSIHVVYWVDSSSPGVFHRAAPIDLGSWTAPELVSPVGIAARRPSAVFHGGKLRVVYEAQDPAQSSFRQIELATREGSFYTRIWIADTLYTNPSWPEVHGAGNRLWIDWIDAQAEMTWTVEQGGSWSPVGIEGFIGGEERDYHVRGGIKKQILDPLP